MAENTRCVIYFSSGAIIQTNEKFDAVLIENIKNRFNKHQNFMIGFKYINVNNVDMIEPLTEEEFNRRISANKTQKFADKITGGRKM